MGLHFAADNIGLSSFFFCKSDVSAVQGHRRSLMLVPIKSAYVTFY